MSFDKEYAVVKFLSDSTYSEIPTAWLIDNNENQQCWWPPRTINSAPLIENCATPNYNTWNRYEVQIIKYCTSLESARKSAANATYETTDEERLGRGKRQHTIYNRYSDSENDDEKEYTNHPPRKYIKKKQINTSNVVTMPLYPSNFGIMNEYINVPQYTAVTFNDASDKENDTLSTINEKQRSDMSHITDKENDPLSTINEKQRSDMSHIPIIIEEYEEPIESVQNSNIKEKLDQILRMQAASNISLRNINERLRKLEETVQRRARSPIDINDDFIAPFLPLKTIEDIKQFESVLNTSAVSVTQFKQFLSKPGGNNAKDNVQRCLKKILTNECAMKCSWKGLRNNFRISNLNFIRIMKKEVILHYSTFTESEFDAATAEWLRFASQRKKRETLDLERE